MLPTVWQDCRFSVVYSFYPRCFFKSCGFCCLLLAKLPAVFLMTLAFFAPPFLAFQIMFRDRSGACFFEHSRPWSEPFFEFPVIQHVFSRRLSAVFHGKIPHQLQQFRITHFGVGLAQRVELPRLFRIGQVRILLDTLFQFSLIQVQSPFDRQNAFAVSIYALFLFPFAGGASLLPPPAVRIYKDVCFISGSQLPQKTVKAMIPMVIASVTNFRCANPLITF